MEELASKTALAEAFRRGLCKVPDLERLLGRVRNAANAPSEGLPLWAIKAAQAK